MVCAVLSVEKMHIKDLLLPLEKNPIPILTSVDVWFIKCCGVLSMGEEHIKDLLCLMEKFIFPS